MRLADLTIRTKLLALAIISILALGIPTIVILSSLYEVAGLFPTSRKLTILLEPSRPFKKVR